MNFKEFLNESNNFSDKIKEDAKMRGLVHQSHNVWKDRSGKKWYWNSNINRFDNYRMGQIIKETKKNYKIPISGTDKKINVVATIHPHSWGVDDEMKVNFTLPNGTTTYRKSKKHVGDCKIDTIDAMAKTIKIVPCKKCGSPAFSEDDEGTINSHRGLCETCFNKSLIKGINFHENFN